MNVMPLEPTQRNHFQSESRAINICRGQFPVVSLIEIMWVIGILQQLNSAISGEGNIVT
jgi:hypothetical protein